MCNTRKDIDDKARIIPGIAFWAFDKNTGKRADQTGYAICNEVKPWVIIATDMVGCPRIFLKRKFRFEVL